MARKIHGFLEPVEPVLKTPLLLAGNDLREKRKKVGAPKRSAKQKKSGKDESSVKLDLSVRKILAVQRLLDIDFILSPSETDTPGDGNCFIHAILDH